MASDNTTSEFSEGPAPIPVLTVAASILVFLVFAGLVGLTYYYGSGLDSKSPTVNYEDQLRELRASEQSILASYGYDEQSKTWQVPVSAAVDSLVQEGESKGQWDTFPKAVVPVKK